MSRWRSQSTSSASAHRRRWAAMRWSSAAAVRAGISGFAEHPFMIDTAGEPMRAAIAPWLDIECRACGSVRGAARSGDRAGARTARRPGGLTMSRGAGARAAARATGLAGGSRER